MLARIEHPVDLASGRGDHLADRHALPIVRFAESVQIELAGEGQAADQAGAKSNAFLVGEADDLDARRERITGFHNRAQHFEAGDGTVSAVEPPPVGHAVEVRASQHPGTGTAGEVTKDIQGRIDARLEPCLPDPVGKPAPASQVGFGPGEPVDPTVSLSTDSRERAQLAQQAAAIDVAHRGTAWESKGAHFRKRPKPRSPTMAPSR